MPRPLETCLDEIASELLGHGASRQQIRRLKNQLRKLHAPQELCLPQNRALWHDMDLCPRTQQLMRALWLLQVYGQGGSKTIDKVESPHDAASLLWHHGLDCEVEQFLVLILNNQNRPLRVEKVARGSVNHCAVDMRELFLPAILHRASAMIVAHNHPAGHCEPSAQDIELTRQIAAASAILRIPLLDHLILYHECNDGNEAIKPQFTSLLERGVMTLPEQALGA